MRARRWAAASLVIASTAFAEPKPKAVDIKPFRDQLIVLQDADGGTYVVLATGDEPRVWYGLPKKPLYAQLTGGRSKDGANWDVSVFAPRVPKFQPGSIQFKDGNYIRWCGDSSQVALTQLTSDRAKTVLDKSSIMSTAFTRKPYLLARDDSGVYYYVDMIRDEYGGNGYRVLVGKKGAMKAKPLTDIATDSAGDVFATKTGDLRFVHGEEDGKSTAAWVKGGKKTELVFLSTESNERMIYKDLGVYTFTGSICENM